MRRYHYNGFVYADFDVVAPDRTTAARIVDAFFTASLDGALPLTKLPKGMTLRYLCLFERDKLGCSGAEEEED